LKPETADYLEKARGALTDARKIAALPLPRVAAREAYLAMFHAAEALIFERTGKIAKTHRGVRAEFVRLARSEPRISRDLMAVLAAAYEYKAIADYAVGPTADLSVQDTANAIGTADRFIETIATLLCQ
jgi:uncharacterized protein (UPF0332 family)